MMEEEKDYQHQNRNLRRNIPSMSPDQFTSVSTYSHSSSSSVTVDHDHNNYINNIINEHSASLLGPSTLWTDERHRLYLDSLEASFVNQLYHSIALRGSLPSRAVPTDSCNSSHKLMIQGDGPWHKINSRRNKPLLESRASSLLIQENPCTSHLSSAGKQHSAACHDLQAGGLSTKSIYSRGNPLVCCGSARSSEQRHACSLCYHNSARMVLEVSDQNFVDEDQGEKSSCMAAVKRLKIVGAETSSNDEVVPLGNSNTSKVSTGSQASCEREEQVQQELLSENHDNFVYSKTDLHYFLRER